MGIPWYFYNIYKKYNLEKDLVINENDVKTMDINHLFLDYNSMIHPCAHQILTVSEHNENIDLDNLVIENCINYTRYIINVIKPNNLYIMIDGVAPRAKMNQQRERRYKSYFLKNIQKSIDQNLQENVNKIDWDSNKITPGTSFMKKLYDKLNTFSFEIKNICNVVVDTSPGEGEHKIMKIIKTINVNQDKICIYGLDADLIMLSLISVNWENIILLRDNTFNKKCQETTYMYMNIKNLKTYICKDIKKNNFIKISDQNLIYDYIFLCFLLGNDFLDHIPSLIIKEGGLDVIMKFYVEIINTGKTIINLEKLNTGKLNESINIDVLKNLFYNLSKSEDYFFQNIYSVYKKDKIIYKDSFDLDKINQTNDIYIYKDDYIKYNLQGYKSRYYKYYGIENVSNICKDYINGLYWVLGYYHNHCHNNWSWYYRHYAVPFVSDLFTYLNYNINIEILDKKTLAPSVPVKELEQLLLVLPKESLLEIILEIDKDIYEKIYRIFNTKDIKEYYPEKIYLDMINKEYLWQSKVFIKQFNNQIINIFL
jgi:5'-3' exoribonuclease 2